MKIVTIKGVPVIDIYESYNGSYWYITEKSHQQDSVINGKVYQDDQIVFGYAKLSACPEFAEFGYISQTELELLSPRVWKVKEHDWPGCPDVKVVNLSRDAVTNQSGEVSPLSFYPHAQPLKGGELKMAWRPTRYLIEGLLDNTQPGKVTGWMRFAGKKEVIKFDLTGNFHRDIQGAKIYFKGDAEGNDPEATSYMKGFAVRQTGKAGDMTAGLKPADYVHGYCYLEWYSEANGRVVLELAQSKVKVIGKPLSPDQCQPISRKEQARNLHEFMYEICRQFSKGQKKGADDHQPAPSGLNTKSPSKA